MGSESWEWRNSWGGSQRVCPYAQSVLLGPSSKSTTHPPSRPLQWPHPGVLHPGAAPAPICPAESGEGGSHMDESEEDSEEDSEDDSGLVGSEDDEEGSSLDEEVRRHATLCRALQPEREGLRLFVQNSCWTHSTSLAQALRIPGQGDRLSEHHPCSTAQHKVSAGLQAWPLPQHSLPPNPTFKQRVYVCGAGRRTLW
jgi:hypothetical protein